MSLNLKNKIIYFTDSDEKKCTISFYNDAYLTVNLFEFLNTYRVITYKYTLKLDKIEKLYYNV